MAQGGLGGGSHGGVGHIILGSGIEGPRGVVDGAERGYKSLLQNDQSRLARYRDKLAMGMATSQKLTDNP